MRLIVIFVYTILIGYSGCNAFTNNPIQPNEPNDIVSNIKSGFAGENPRMFFDKLSKSDISRISKLVEQCGYSSFKWEEFEVAANGQIRLWDHRVYRKQVLILNKSRGAFILNTPQGTHLDLANTPVAWKDPNCGRYEWIFKGNRKVKTGKTVFDDAGLFFGTGGHYFDYEEEKSKDIPIRIYSVNAPKILLAESRYMYSPEVLFTTDERVYIVGTIWDHPRSNSRIEVYRRSDEEGLKFDYEYTINCPRIFGAKHLVIDSCYFDSKHEELYCRLYTDKFVLPRFYVFDLKQKQLSQLKKKVYGKVFYTDPSLIDGILDKTQGGD